MKKRIKRKLPKRKLTRAEKRVRYTKKAVKSERRYIKGNKRKRNKKPVQLLRTKNVDANSVEESGVESIRLASQGIQALADTRGIATRVKKTGSVVINVFKIPHKIKLKRNKKKLKRYLLQNRQTRTVTEKYLKYKGLKKFSNAKLKYANVKISSVP